jgi:hypothetical protein
VRSVEVVPGGRPCFPYHKLCSHCHQGSGH